MTVLVRPAPLAAVMGSALPDGLRLTHATVSGSTSGFVQLSTGLRQQGLLGTVLAQIGLPGAIQPWHWDRLWSICK